MFSAIVFATLALLPPHEMSMIDGVAKEYGLTHEQKCLLISIRKVENGRPGLEFGVGGPMDSGHPAHRFRDGEKSFICQARWAAGTIKRRYKGDIDAFSRRYCPANPKRWARIAKKYMPSVYLNRAE